MTKAPESNEREIGKTDVSASRWVKPGLTRLAAGNAEVNPAPLADANGEFS